MFIFSYGNSVASKKDLNCQFEMVKWDCFPRYGENSTFLRGGTPGYAPEPVLHPPKTPPPRCVILYLSAVAPYHTYSSNDKYFKTNRN